MADTELLARDSEFAPDLSPLAWVHEELRRSLESVHKTLRRLLRDGDTRISALSSFGVDSSPPSPPMQAAAAQLHQVAGVLQLVGLQAGAAVLRASEIAVESLASRPETIAPDKVETIERAHFALLSYVARVLAGNNTSTLALFPSFRELQVLNGAERIHPADLWQFEWRWADIPRDTSARALPQEAVRAPFESGLLKHMRAPTAETAATLSDLCAALAAGLSAPRSRTVWQLSAAFFQAQAMDLLTLDPYIKRMASRLLSQMRVVSQGDQGVNERLANDLLFFCAQSRPSQPGQPAPRLQAVLAAYGLGGDAAGDYEDEALGRIDPAWVAQARRRVSVAKESWSSAAEGDTHRLAGLDEQFAALSESLARLFPSGEVLGQTLQRAIVSTLRSGKAPAPGLAMEVATSMLYVEAALDDAAFDQPEQAERVQRLAARVESAARGEPPEPLEAWMEELYRRVSDRQTLGSVVHELRASLSEIERQADDYFRDPSQRQLLIPVPGQLSAMRGVLTVLGLDQAAHACLRMRDEVDALANTEVDASLAGPRELFERLANNLGALGFLIDMLSVQPQLAKRMFRFDEASSRLDAVMGRRAGAVVVPEPLLPADLDEPVGPPPGFELHLLQLPADLPSLDLDVLAPEPLAVSEPEPEPQPEPDAPAQPAPLLEIPHTAPVTESATADDPEMRAIFLEEAAEVLDAARAALAELHHEGQGSDSSRAHLTVLRRAFHTLKGSARMVGLTDFGEGAWACEQLYNARLGDAQPLADEALLAFTREAVVYLGDWVEQIAGQRGGDHRSDPLRRSADALRVQGEVLALGWPAAAPLETLLEVPVELPVELTVELPAELAAELPVEAAVEAPIELALDPAIEVPDEPEIVAEEAFAFDLPTVFLDMEPEAEAVVEPARVIEPSLDEGFVLDLPEVVDLSAADASPAAELLAPSQASDAAFELPDLGFHLDLGELVDVPAAIAEPTAETTFAATFVPAPAAPLLELVPPSAAPDAEAEAQLAAEQAEADSVKVIGPLRISITLFNIFLNEADELSRRLCTSLAEWALELARPVPAEGEALAHALAGNAATVGYEDLSVLARALEHALDRAQRASRYTDAEAALFVRAADDIRHLLHQFAAGFLRPHDALLVEALESYEPALDPVSQADSLAQPLDETPVPRADADEVEPGLPDQIEPELFPIFEEEAQELLPRLHGALRGWLARPADVGLADACMRALHTFKGGARLTGAMRLGEQAHLLESAIERVMHQPAPPAHADVLPLQEQGDALEASFEALCAGLRATDAAAPATPLPVVGSAAAPEVAPEFAPEFAADGLPDPAFDGVFDGVSEALLEPVVELPSEVPAEAEPALDLAPAVELTAVESVVETAEPAPAPGPQIDWTRFADGDADDSGVEVLGGGAQAMVRVRGSLLERMASQAGEVSIRRARLESELAQMKSSLLDLDDNLERLRGQLRELELQAEAQVGAQQELAMQAKAGGGDFDPLEFDRYTRFQELTRMLSESVGDVATVQRALQRNVQLGEDELAAQSRLTRELQDDLLRTRLVEFDSLSERMHRVVRQASRDAGRQAKLEITGGQIELDRSVLERMAGAFEHLLRNSVSHGIETPEARKAAGKAAEGTVRVQLQQAGNEVLLNFSDDGAGLNLARIRERGLQLGLIQAGAEPDEATLTRLIFAPGFSTAAQVTELSGRGVGMDVVRADVSTLGGSITTSSVAGQGAQFALRLPLTTALTQIVLLRAGDQVIAVPASLMDSVQRVPVELVDAAYASGSLEVAGSPLPFYWLGGLLGHSGRGHGHGKTMSIVLVKSAQQRLALHVDEVVGNQEVVIKNLGPQLNKVPGLAGISLLASGDVALIYNPAALADWYGQAAQQRLQTAPAQRPVEGEGEGEDAALAPLVLVVDDSLTVRRVTQRLLEREGYRVQLAKDGLDAMEHLAADELPSVVLSDIEMPRMDGFDLVRNMRADARLAALPVIMITSRIAPKHRDYAQQLGVDDYLGKPYDEQQLLALIGRYTAPKATADKVLN